MSAVEAFDFLERTVTRGEQERWRGANLGGLARLAQDQGFALDAPALRSLAERAVGQPLRQEQAAAVLYDYACHLAAAAGDTSTHGQAPGAPSGEQQGSSSDELFDGDDVFVFRAPLKSLECFDPAGEGSLRAFATPLLDSFDGHALVNEARLRRARRVADAVVERFGETLSADEHRFVSEVLPAHSGSNHRATDRALGLLGCLSPGKPEAIHVALARAALLLASDGVAVSFASSLESPARMLWRDQLLDYADYVEISPDEPTTITTGLNGRKTVHTTSEAASVATLPRSPVSGTLPEWRLLPAWVTDAVPVHTAFELSPLPASEVFEYVERGRALMRRATPGMLRNVDAVVHDLVPLASSGDTTFSASHRAAPGMVGLGVPIVPANVGELLVHEAAHQYFHLASQFGPVDDGSDTKLYWSPLRQMGRPIERCLLAHHALTNSVLYFRSLIEGSMDVDGFAERHIEDYSQKARKLEEALDATSALTIVGRSLYRKVEELRELPGCARAVAPSPRQTLSE